MSERFEVAAGTVAGRHHRLAGRGSQDALYWTSRDGCLVAVVADGCGSGRHSEVGATLGARLVAESLVRHLAGAVSTHDLDRALERARQDALAHLRVLALALGGSFSQAVSDYLLFTVVGVAVADELAAVFALGDGLYAVNGEVATVGPFPRNAPPYLAYALLDGLDPCFAPDALRLHVLRALPTSLLRSLLVATDGARDLAGLEARVPFGESRPVGPLSQFWTDERYFANPDALRRKLAALNRQTTRPDPESGRLIVEPGLLPDDTTLLVLRRRDERPREEV